MTLKNFLCLLDQDELNRVHSATIEVLDQVGIELQLDEALGIFKKHGAKTDGNRVMIPEIMLERAIRSAPASFELCARNPRNSIMVGEGQDRTHVEPANGAVHVLDGNGYRRPGELRDLVEFYKLAQASEVCDISGAVPVEPSDVDPVTGYLDIFLETLRHTDKPIKSNVYPAGIVKHLFQMLEIAMGEEGYLGNHHAIYASVNPLSPLAFDAAPLETLMTYARHNQPVAVLSCALAGISAPMGPMGVCVMQNAEILAGLVLCQLIKPGVPVIYSPASAVPNMQNGQYVTGSPESNMINVSNIQLARDLYKLPTRTMAGLTDAKTADCQAGYETMQNLFMCMAGGANIINECLGGLDSIMINSFEKFVLDEEMISRILRFMEGMEGAKNDLGVNVIRDIGIRGSFLDHPDTITRCRSAWRPRVSCWENYDKWKESGADDVSVKAGQRVAEILETCSETTLDPAVAAELESFTCKIKGK